MDKSFIYDKQVYKRGKTYAHPGIFKCINRKIRPKRKFTDLASSPIYLVYKNVKINRLSTDLSNKKKIDS